MKNFISVRILHSGNKALINVTKIESVIEQENETCNIFLIDKELDDDHYKIKESYEVVTQAIPDAQS